jgi:hypothetical protein
VRNLIVFLTLIVSFSTFAAPGEPVRRMTEAQARERVQKSRTYEDILKMQADPKMHNELMAKIEAVVKLNLKDVVALDSVSQNGLVSMVNVNPLAALSEVARLSSIVKDPTVSAREKQMAQTTLRLMAASAKTISGVTRNKTEAAAQKAAVGRAIALSNKIAALSLSPAAKKFVESFERALREGKNPEEAVRVASNGKFTEKELRECE